MLCDYGCGQEAKYTIGNGKLCCSKHHNSCPEIRKKNSKGVIKRRIIEKESGISRRYTKGNCRFCGIEFSNNGGGLKKHEKTCYLNPKVLKPCPVCNKPIKDKLATTCSVQCAQIYFRDKYNYIRANRDMSWVEDLYGSYTPDKYTDICFKYHGKKCIICGEDIAVAVHHYDNDNTNNDPRNLIPLCPTHHVYIHSTVENMYYIKECVDEYIQKFIENYCEVA